MIEGRQVIEIVERIKRTVGPDRQLDFAIQIVISGAPSVVPTQYLRHGDDAPSTPLYSASIDDALALVERLRPGAEITLHCGATGSWAVLSGHARWPEGLACTAPLAILLALLHSLATSDTSLSSPGPDRR